MSHFLLTVAAGALLFLACFAGIGLVVWTGRRKRPDGCSCGFDPDAARRKAGCRGDRCAGSGTPEG